MFRRLKLVPGLILLGCIAACNSNSDAISILQSENTSLKATLASYENLGATVTAEATTMAQKLATTQAQLSQAQAQNSELVAKLNSGSTSLSGGNQGNNADPMASTGGGAANNTSTDNNTGDASTTDSAGLTLAQVVTTKQQDANGCAVGQSTVFSVNDAKILVVADVRNYKNGTEFTATWSGDNFSHENSWTISENGSQICVHFYIEPSTLEMAPGAYTVTLKAGTTASQSVQFTVEDSTSQ